MAGTPVIVLNHEVSLEMQTIQALDGLLPDLF